MHHDLTALDPRNGKHGGWRVVVETPRGSGAKYDYDPDLGAFTLAHILPEGFVFPYAFGFVPSTLGDDGDPLDVLLMIEEEAPSGCVVASRVIGVIEGEQREKHGKPERNDRFLAVPLASRRFATFDSAHDLPRKQVDDLCQFFENYNQVLGREFKVVKWTGPDAADKLIRKGLRAYRSKAKHR